MDIILGIYCISALLLTVYGINNHVLINLFQRRFPDRINSDQAFLAAFYRRQAPFSKTIDTANKLQTVTTQLPVFQ